jgi:6-phosphogluconolactonase (cycloisomerase 2 family)
MNSAHGKYWQTLVMTLVGACLLPGCHHHSSSAADTTPDFAITVSVSGLAGTGLVLENNGVDNLSVTASGISTFTNVVPDFTTYSVTVLTQPASPAQICSVLGGTGLVNGATVTVPISCGTVGTAFGRYAYAVNSGAGSLSGYAINSSTGALTALAGSPLVIPGSSALHQALIDPSGSFLYVVDSGANEVFAYQLNQSTGSGQPIGGSPFATGKTPVSLTFDYTGTYMYVANNADNTISAYTVTIATGALTPIPGSPFAVSGTNPGPTQIIAAGAYLFAMNSNTSTVDVFSITPGTGALTETGNGSPYPTDTGPHSLAIDPTGKVLFTANLGPANAGSISAFTLDLSVGVLTPVAGNPLAIPVLNNISIDSLSKYLFVTEAAGVAVYPIVNTATGALDLTPVIGSPFAAGTNPYSVSVDVLDELVYVANQGSGSVSAFAFYPANGAMAPIPGSAEAAGAGTEFIQIQ